MTHATGTEDSTRTELVAAKDAEISRLREIVAQTARRGDLFDARLLSFRAAEAEYRAQIAALQTAQARSSDTASTESATSGSDNARLSDGSQPVSGASHTSTDPTRAPRSKEAADFWVLNPEPAAADASTQTAAVGTASTGRTDAGVCRRHF